MQNAAKHASLEPPQKPPPSSSNNLELQLTNFISLYSNTGNTQKLRFHHIYIYIYFNVFTWHPWHTRCFDRSKEKNWIAMRKPDFYILLRQYKIYINRTDTPPRLLLSLCFCSPQPLCFLCLLCCIWCSSLLLPNHVNTAQELQRRSKKLCSAWDSHTLDPQPAIQQLCLWAAEPEARSEQTKCHHIDRDMGEKWPA